jgi:hypothetical protein
MIAEGRHHGGLDAAPDRIQSELKPKIVRFRTICPNSAMAWGGAGCLPKGLRLAP